MKGYFAFPPSCSTSTPPQPSRIGDGIYICHNVEQDRNAKSAVEEQRRKRRELERAFGERSEMEWVRAGGILRDALGRRNKARTEQIRRELQEQEVERQKMARWETYEARWRAVQSTKAVAAIAFVDFPWPLAASVSVRDLSLLTRDAVSGFLFESLSVRTSTTTRKERIRNSLLRWHPDKISLVLGRVVSDDLELVQEGIHTVFRILKALQDAERTGTV